MRMARGIRERYVGATDLAFVMSEASKFAVPAASLGFCSVAIWSNALGYLTLGRL
jgi:hypothetical protein